MDMIVISCQQGDAGKWRGQQNTGGGKVVSNSNNLNLKKN
jgi:hypothetical protein